MVVISIIALLIAILLPALGAARDSARITQCATHVRTQAQQTTIQATDFKQKIPGWGNHYGLWGGGYGSTKASSPDRIDPDARDKIVNDYGMARDYFYCPSNEGWNLDDHWNHPTEIPIGYQIYAGKPRLANARNSNGLVPAGHGRPAVANSDYSGGFQEVPVNKKVFHESLDDLAFYDEVASDLTYAYKGQFRGALGKTVSRANHLEAQSSDGDLLFPDVGGSNVSFIDGHTEWRKANDMGQTASPYTGMRQVIFGSTRRYWF